MDLNEEDAKFLNSLRIQPHGFKFQNWARTFSSQPTYYVAPTSEQDISRIVRIANKHKLTVKAVGSGHSPSDIACTNAIMLNMDKMNRFISCDAEAATVQGGMRLYQLHEELKQRQLALSNLGSISDQSIAGAIATATHGTGIEYGDMSDMVVGLVLIDGQGQRQECSLAHNRSLLDAARCHLGALGIVTQVTIKCEPMFWLRAVQEPESFISVTQDLHAVAKSAEHVRVWWFPHTDNVVVWRANRTRSRTRKSPESFVRDRLYGFHIYQMQLLKARCFPNSIPHLTREHFARRFDFRREWVDEGFRVFNFDCLFPQYVNEWAIPLDQAAEALQELQQWTDESGARVHFPVEIRFVRGTSVWLSPASGDQIVCYIGVIMYRPYHRPVPYKAYWQAFERIMRKHEGRPHWAKAHGMFFHDFVSRYPRFNQFLETRNQCDPHHVFVNDYLRRHILPPGTSQNQQESQISTENPRL
ncbi:D-arabinono-1,4-lactone oxidase [Coemansia sp. RSA 1250]|nr:D-arabinono-1,4-lactone oxidase [Coemansia sp. RSA 1250]